MANGYKITQIPGSYLGTDPQISGNNVIWQTFNSSGQLDIYLYNGASTLQLTKNSKQYIYKPLISENNVVWKGWDGNDNEIYLYNGVSTIQLTNNNHNDREPQISGNNVVWRGLDQKNSEIYFYDGTSTLQFTNNNYVDGAPQISGNKIVWVGSPVIDYEIYFYNGASTLQLTKNIYSDTNPKISGNNVVWQGFENFSDWEIYLYNGASTLQLTKNIYNDINPQISGNNVVWQGFDGNDDEIYFYNGASTINLSNNYFSDNNPQISGNNVVWQGYDGNDDEIYLYNGASTIQLTNNNYDDSDPQISGDNVVWQGGNGIYLATPGKDTTISVKSTAFTTTGDGKTSTIKFQVSLDQASTQQVTVDYSTLDGTTNSSDYDAVAKKTLTFAPGETQKEITITVKGDKALDDKQLEIFSKDIAYDQGWEKGSDIDQNKNNKNYGDLGYRVNKAWNNKATGFNAVGLTSDESFFLVLSNPQNATIAQPEQAPKPILEQLDSLLGPVATRSDEDKQAYQKANDFLNQQKDQYTFATGTIYNSDKDPILAIRGTEPTELQDVIADTNPNSIGYNQFLPNKTDVEKWLKDVSSPENGKVTLNPNITGHSLGGAIAQLFAANYQGNLGQVVTFNAPGISTSEANKFNTGKAEKVKHYITSGDVVSMAGEKFIPGNVILSKFSELLSAINFHKHRYPVVADKLYDADFSKPADLTTTSITSSQLSDPNFTYHPDYQKLQFDWDYLVLQLAVATISPETAKKLTYRQDVEATRKTIGKTIEKAFQIGKILPDGVTLELNDYDLSVKNLLIVKAKDVSIDYLKIPEETLTFQGKFTIPTLNDATIDLTEDKAIKLTEDGWEWKGKISIPEIAIAKSLPAWKLKDIILDIDSASNQISATAKLKTPDSEIFFNLKFNNGKLISVTANNGVGTDFSWLGTEVDLRDLTFTGDINPGNQDDWEPEFKLQGVITLPSFFNNTTIDITGANALILSENGLKLTGGKLNLPDFNFDLFKAINVKGQGLSLEYTTVPKEFLKIQGKILIPTLYNTIADFAGDNYLKISDQGVDAVGFISVENVKIAPKIWEIKQAKLTFDKNNSISGQGKIIIPTGIELDGGIGFVNKQLNNISLQANNLNKPIGSTGLFLQKIVGKINNIAPSSPQAAEFGGGVGVTAGVKVNVSLPSWAGGNFSGSLVDLDINGSISKDRLIGNGGIKVIGGLLSGNGGAELNWSKGFLSAQSNYSILGGLINTQSAFKATSNLDIAMGGMASVKMPEVVPFIGGKQLTNAKFAVNYFNNGSLADDYVAGWGSISIPIPTYGSVTITKGVKVFLNGAWNIIGEADLPTSSSNSGKFANSLKLSKDNLGQNVVGSRIFSVADKTPWILLGSSWNNASTQTTVRLKDPNGNYFNESDFSSKNIAIVGALSDSTKRTVAIANPVKGNWTIEVLSNTNLGTVNFAGIKNAVDPTLNFTSVTNNLNTKKADINWNAVDPDSVAKVSLYYDTDNQGNDGILITSGLKESDGISNYSWDTSKLQPGKYYLYAAIEDEQNAPVYNYSQQAITIPDASSSISIADFLGTEGENNYITSVVTLSQANANPITVNYTTVDGTAKAGSDYVGSSGTLTFLPGETTKNIAITLIDDNISETDIENFKLVLSNPSSSGTIAKSEAIGKIADTWYSPTTFTLKPTIENLYLTGSTNVNGTGNNNSNQITGSLGNNLLKGLDGNDTIKGGVGDDTTDGGNGNDSYVYTLNGSSGSDQIIEASNGGVDTIDFTGSVKAVNLNLGLTTLQTVAPYGLNLQLSGSDVIEKAIAATGNDTLIGNTLNNSLSGAAGNDQLSGGVGNDTLTGGEGNDSFVFSSSAFSSANLGVDTISDFASTDKILLKKTTFSSLTTNAGNSLNNSDYASVGNASDASVSSATIIYNTSTGSLIYNADGATPGFGSGGIFATLSLTPVISASNLMAIS